VLSRRFRSSENPTRHNPAPTGLSVTDSVSIQQLDEAQQKVSGARCWILSDGKAGDEAQCLGVAERLGLVAEIRRVAPRAPFVWAMPWGPIDPREAPGRSNSPLAPPWPDIAIASGRRTFAYLRHLKRASGGKVFTVYLKDPGTSPEAVDLVWVPQHDKLRGKNVIVTLTSPHRLSPEKLAAERVQIWREGAGPRVGVLLGGDSQHHRFKSGNIADLTAKLMAWAAHGARLFITPSRRTPLVLAHALRDLCEGTGDMFWDGTGNNPYLGILAGADHFVVTADSVNMLGEAAATGKPIHLFTPSGGHTKISSFVSGLERHGAVRPLSASLETWSYEPLDATPVIAVALAKAYAARQR
jgi:uncharacterized protein